MMQSLKRDPCPELQESASQEQFGYELSSHMFRGKSGGGFRVRLGCRWLACPSAVGWPYPATTARLFRSASESEVISELTTGTGSIDH